MKLVETLVVRDDKEMLEAHLAFQLAMGVDLVIAAVARRNDDGVAEVIERYERDGVLRLVAVDGGSRADGDIRRELDRLAVAEHGADWVLGAEADELWLPRGESLPAILSFIPPRYSVVQALVRVFPPRPAADGQPFWERMTVRPSLLSPEAIAEPLERALRWVRRGTLVRDRATPVPLRAWYPIEVLRFPLRSVEQVVRRLEEGVHPPRSALEDAAAALHAGQRLAASWADVEVDADAEVRGLADGSLVVDERARQVLEALRASDTASGGTSLARAPSSRPTATPPPGIVEDATYAVECAAVGEVDLDLLWSHIAALEQHLALLEQRFWTRVQRRLERLVRR